MQRQSGDLADQETELEAREGELDARETALDERETAIDAAEPAPVPVINEGVWSVGLDIEPGTYRLAEEIGPDRFYYWAIYETGTTQQEIVTNGIPTGGRPQVTLAEGQDFETSDCGSWEQM
ncbi:hypothetical protein [Flaviflexus equikiangi]|uniref:Uncharacterized protein n=1 Tax=Flaviflexus equikiangi TaxID=2758573 RepID=A0ABS2TIP0_9ACTO|nr:hypothetical protein [Flaviflexus equikiangi]MBM9433993.1 hypothetical protein [Flaviflexus equikiangi]